MRFAIGCYLRKFDTWFCWKWDDGGWVTVCENWGRTLPIATHYTLKEARYLLRAIHAQYPHISAFLTPIKED